MEYHILIAFGVLFCVLAYAGIRVNQLKNGWRREKRRRLLLNRALDEAVDELLRRAQDHERKSPRITKMDVGDAVLMDLRPTERESGVTRMQGIGSGIFKVSRNLSWDGERTISAEWEIDSV